MSKANLLVLQGAAPADGAALLDLVIDSGVTCLVANDEHLASSYLRMMAGLAKAASGSVALLGERVNGGLSDNQPLRRRIGYVAPQAPLLSVLDGVRNVMLPALYHGIAAEAVVAERARQLIDEMGYEGDPRQLPAFMPELQRRMLLIARALILEPPLLFIEQPLIGLDSAACDRLCDYICGVVVHRVKALVIASNDPILASGASQLVFIGRESAPIYGGWRELVAERSNEVREFIDRERRFCSILQD